MKLYESPKISFVSLSTKEDILVTSGGPWISPNGAIDGEIDPAEFDPAEFGLS